MQIKEKLFTLKVLKRGTERSKKCSGVWPLVFLRGFGNDTQIELANGIFVLMTNANSESEALWSHNVLRHLEDDGMLRE